MTHFQCLACSETNIYNQSSSNVIERCPLSTFWSPEGMEPSLLMFIHVESPIIQTDTLILILIMTVNRRPAQQQLFCT